MRPPARPLDPAAVLERMPDGLALDDAAMYLEEALPVREKTLHFAAG